MRDIILNHINKVFGEASTGHHSYCSALFEDCTCKKLSGISYDTPLIGGYIDSFSMVAILIFLETRFNVSIPDIDAVPENFNTVNRMVSLVEKYQ